MFPFKAIEQRTFLATDISTGTSSDIDMKVKPFAEDILAEQPRGFRCGDGAFKRFQGLRIFIAEVDKPRVAPVA